MSIFERIAMLRGERGLSQNALEREVGLPRNTICKWDKSVPSADKLKMVADYFGVTVDYLLTGEEKEPQAVDPQAAQFDRLFQRLSAEDRLTIIQKMLELSEKE